MSPLKLSDSDYPVIHSVESTGKAPTRSELIAGLFGLPPKEKYTTWELLGVSEDADVAEIESAAANRLKIVEDAIRSGNVHGKSLETLQSLPAQIGQWKAKLMEHHAKHYGKAAETPAEKPAPAAKQAPGGLMQWFRNNVALTVTSALGLAAGAAVVTNHFASGTGPEKAQAKNLPAEAPTKKVEKDVSTTQLNTKLAARNAVAQPPSIPSLTSVEENPFDVPVDTKPEATKPKETIVIEANTVTPVAETSGANAKPLPEEPVRPTIDKKAYDDVRASLESVGRGKPSNERIDAILEFGRNPDIMRDPSGLKAVYDHAFDTAVKAKNVAKAKEVYARMKAHEELYPSRAAERDALIALIKELGAERSMKHRDRADDRQDLVNDLMAIATELSTEDPDAAQKLLPPARGILGTQYDVAVKKGFNQRFDALEASIKDAKEFKAADEALKKNPNDPEQRKLRGLAYLSRGETKPALEDLAASNHMTSDLAKESLAMMANPRMAAGKRALQIARTWTDLASKTTNGKKASLQRIAVDLFDVALSTGNDGLNPVDKKLVQGERDALAATIPVGSKPTVVQKPVVPEVAVEPEAPKIPTRPKTVPEGASYSNGKWRLAANQAMHPNDAVKLANQMGATLAGVRSSEDISHILSIVPPGTRQVHLNARRINGRWFDSRGTEVKSFTWDNGEPSGGPNEDQSLVLRGNGKMNDLKIGDEANITIPVLEWDHATEAAKGGRK